jgi:hypothetical protein
LIENFRKSTISLLEGKVILNSQQKIFYNSLIKNFFFSPETLRIKYKKNNLA